MNTFRCPDPNNPNCYLPSSNNVNNNINNNINRLLPNATNPTPFVPSPSTPLMNQLAAECQANPNNSFCANLSQSVNPSVATKPPISCIEIFLAEGVNCNSPPNPIQAAKAKEAFLQATGFKAPNVNGSIEKLSNTINTAILIDSVYFYIPWVIMFIVVIWLAVLYLWISWPVAIILTILVFILAYLSSVLLRATLSAFLDKETDEMKKKSNGYKKELEAALVKFPQGILSAICAYVGTPWQCAGTGQTGTTGTTGQTGTTGTTGTTGQTGTTLQPGPVFTVYNNPLNNRIDNPGIIRNNIANRNGVGGVNGVGSIGGGGVGREGQRNVSWDIEGDVNVNREFDNNFMLS